MLSTPRHHLGVTLMRLIRLLPYFGAARRVSRSRDGLFDSAYYLRCNPDVEASTVHPLLHFLLFGAFEGRKPNALFDPEFYLDKYPDVAHAGVNPLLHYLKRGAMEGRKPHSLFAPKEAGNSLSEWIAALKRPADEVLYSWWLREETLIEPPAPAQTPRFSLLIAVSEDRRESLEATVESVRAQDYPNWELWICNTAPRESWLKDRLDAAACGDTRIRPVHFQSEVQACTALNHAANRAAGEYIAVLNQGDRLRRDALRWLAAEGPADVLYSDEDLSDASGRRCQPLFKPDWSPDLLLSCMYLGRMAVISRDAWQDAGGLRPEYGEAAEYDLLLRISERYRGVRHVARVLCSRPEEQPSEPPERSRARDCIIGALRRRGAPAEVEPGPRPGCFRPHWKASGTELVSIIICSRSAHLLERCLASLASHTSYARREIFVVQHLNGSAPDLEAVIARHGAARLTYSGTFHFSRMNNMAAKVANGTILVFLNDDTEVLEASWLERLVAQVERADVGVAGARLLYASGTLQHGGVAVGVGDGSAHIGRDMQFPPNHWPWLDLTRDVSAVTGACFAIRAPVFHGVGAFPEIFPVNYNDIDLCLRVRQAGYRVIYESGAVLRHYECQSRRGVVTPEERRRWRERWGGFLAAGDPFYNRNLSRMREDLSLRSALGDH